MKDLLYRIVVKIRIAEGGLQSRFLSTFALEDILFFVFLGMFLVGAALFGGNQYTRWKDAEILMIQQQELAQLKEKSLEAAAKEQAEKEESIEEAANEILEKFFQEDSEEIREEEVEEDALYAANGMLAEYETLYQKNQDMVGWLTIEDTVVDYPVMQTPGDEEYYLRRDFSRNSNQNGCLLMDTDSVVGTGRQEKGYEDGKSPSSNLIIHGHTMKTGAMFGTLERYKKEEYGKEHNILRFDSLYEKREYELIAVFYSQVYKAEEEVFKYYKFFQADTPGEFDDWYRNIKKLSLYDTGVTAKFGDQFITLSCCAYPSEDKRFVVVGKRVK